MKNLQNEKIDKSQICIHTNSLQETPFRMSWKSTFSFGVQDMVAHENVTQNT